MGLSSRTIGLTVVLFSAILTAGSIGAEAAEEAAVLRCWRCEISFQVPDGTGSGNCPSCDAPFVSAPPPGEPLAAAATRGTPPPYGVANLIPFQEAENHVDRTVTIEANIIGTFLSPQSGDLFLNYHRDFRRYVSVMIPAQYLSLFPPNPDSYYRYTAVRATGRVHRTGEYLRQVVTRPADLEVIGELDPTLAPMDAPVWEPLELERELFVDRLDLDETSSVEEFRNSLEMQEFLRRE